MPETSPSPRTRIRFGDLLIGGTRNGIYKPKDFHGRGAKIVNMGELFAHSRLGNIEMKRVELTPNEMEKSTLLPGDLLFARRSLIAEGAGKCSIVCEVSEPTTFESSIIRARVDRAKADPFYIYYLFNSPTGRHLLQTILRQVAVAGITGTDLVGLELPVPRLAEQERVAAALRALDEKIELNRRMNETLEAMARALFRSWFVDFDPVRSKAEGQAPAGMDARTAKLFPDEFQSTEKGKIPRGWVLGTLGDVADAPRRTVDPTEIEGTVAYIGLEHMPRRSIALSEWETASTVTSQKARFEAGEILFGKLRPYFHKVGVAPLAGVCSTDIIVVVPKAPEMFALVLGHLSSDELIKYSDQCSTGTKMPRVSWRDLARYPVVLPPAPVAAACTAVIQPLVQRMGAAIHESKALAATRDALLPGLLSGELRVAD